MSSNGPDERGLLVVISAPSGTGKTTVVDRLMVRYPRLWRSRSYTSRAPRPGETDGVDYNFVSRETFDGMVRRGEFLEWANIYDNLYGTARRDTERTLELGVDLVLVIDVQGARQVRQRMPDAVGVFVLPPSFEALAARLRGRNQDSPQAIERRLATARAEVSAIDEYDYVIVNDDLERCVGEIDAIMVAERARRSRRRRLVAPIIETFKNRA